MTGSSPARTAVGPSRQWVPAVAAVVTGIAGGVTLIVSQRHLGLEAMAPLAQLWTIWAVMAAGLTFSFQQWAAIHPVRVTSLLGRGGANVMFALLALAVATGVVSRLNRDTLFHSTDWVWPVAAALLPLGTALNGVCRGVLARRRRTALLGAAIAGENVIRLGVTILFVATARSAPWFALALLSGFAVIALSTEAGAADQPTDVRAGRALGASAAAGFLAYAFMFGSPILLGAAGGSSTEIAALFLVLTGVRVPFVVLQALVPQLAVRLADAPDRPALIATTRRRIAGVAVVGGVVAAIGGWWLGNALIGSVFGIKDEIGDASYSMLSAASVLAACALVATVVLVVEGRSAQIAVAWGAAAVTGVVVAARGMVDEVPALSLWLMCAHAGVVVLALIRGRRSRSAYRGVTSQ